MDKSFRAGRLGAKYYWRIGSQHRVRCLQKRHYADRYTFDDMTQSRIDAINKATADAGLQSENPWRTNYPEDLNDIGFESHCNDRLYTAKNNFRHSLEEYGLKRLERRLESQERFKKHFNSDAALGNTELQKVSVMQDLSKHKKRQGDIIEMNRRMWQSRPQVKREINLSGITYRPDQHQHLTANEHHRNFSRDQERSEAETKPEAEQSVFQRGMKRLIGRYNASPEAERADSRTHRPMADKDFRVRSRRPEAEEAEEAEKDFRFGGQSQSSALQSRLMELMEAESKPEAEEDEWRMKSRRPEAEDDERQMKSPRAEAEVNEWRMKSRRPEAEEDEWRMKSPRAEAEFDDWRMKSRRPEAEEDEWRMKSPRAEAEDKEWRLKSRRPEAEEDEWRMKSPRAEAEVNEWRMKSRRPEAEDEWRMKSFSSKNLQRRLKELMEAETKPEAEEAEEAERTQSPKAEAERSPRSEAEHSPRSEAEKQKEAEDKAWKARNLSLIYDPNRPSMDSPKKREQQVESQYWHSWHTCPSSQEAETTVQLKPHPRRRRIAIRPPPYTRDGQRRSYHQTALYPQPIEVQPKPLANAPLMPKPLRAIPKKEKKSKPKRKRERRSVEPPRFKMTIRSRPLVARRPTPVPSYLRRLNLLSEVAGPSFHMANLHETPLNANYAG